MIRVDDSIETKILGDNREYQSTIQANWLSLRFDNSVAVLAPNAQTGSIPDQIVEDSLDFDPNRFFLGTRLPARLFPSVANIYAGQGYTPRRVLYKSKVGYIGPLANGAGIVADLIGIRISPRVIQTVQVETAPGRVLVDFTLTVYSQDREILGTREVADNASTSLVFNFPELAKPAAYYELSVTRATPGKRLWIIKFSPSLSTIYGPDDIIKWSMAAKKTQNKEATIGRVYIRSLDVTLFNGGRSFDVLNTASRLYRALLPNVELVAQLSLDGVQFPVGTFYAQSWDPPESGAEVTVKAVDLLGKVKDNVLDAQIVDQINAAAAFALVAAKLGLTQNTIEGELSGVVLRHFGLGDTVGNILNELCINTHAVCYMNPQNTGLIVKRMVQLKGRSRYPVRYLGLDEYISAKITAADPNPTVLEVDYTLQQYDQEEVILTSQTRMYSTLPLRTYPPALSIIPTYNREIGAGQAPSWVSAPMPKPAGFTRVLFSDSFEWESLEFTWEDLGTTVQFKVWNFDNDSVDEQLTAQLVGYLPNPNTLISDTSQVVPPRPGDYLAQAVSDDVADRNAANKPYEFAVQLSDKIAISSIVPGNFQRPGLFEFTLEPTAFGCKCRVWNYLNVEQDFQVLIYGRKLTNSETTKTMTLRDETGIRARGEITKPVSLSNMNDDAMARSVASGVQAYYRSFLGKTELEPWSDPRLEIGDLVAVESLRGYGFTPSMVDELTLEYTGTVIQKVTALQTQKHNRDCRMFGGHVLKDRPLIAKGTKGYV